ncbi:MAG: hypothetical protein ACTHNS_15605 [Marmoricola sp.]
MKIRILLITLALAVTGVATSAPSASASGSLVDTGRACNYRTYRDHTTVRVSSTRPVITHLRTKTLPPGGRESSVRTSKATTTLGARVRYNASISVSASLAARILAKASAKTDVTLAARGSRTTSRAVTIRESIRNGTRHNATYVYFRAHTVVSGSFRSYSCYEVHRNGESKQWHVKYAPGHYSSFSASHSGAPRCGTPGGNSAARLALRYGCQ